MTKSIKRGSQACSPPPYPKRTCHTPQRQPTPRMTTHTATAGRSGAKGMGLSSNSSLHNSTLAPADLEQSAQLAEHITKGMAQRDQIGRAHRLHQDRLKDGVSDGREAPRAHSLAAQLRLRGSSASRRASASASASSSGSSSAASSQSQSSSTSSMSSTSSKMRRSVGKVSMPQGSSQRYGQGIAGAQVVQDMPDVRQRSSFPLLLTDHGSFLRRSLSSLVATRTNTWRPSSKSRVSSNNASKPQTLRRNGSWDSIPKTSYNHV